VRRGLRQRHGAPPRQEGRSRWPGVLGLLDVRDDRSNDVGPHCPEGHPYRGRPRRWVKFARICPVGVRRQAAGMELNDRGWGCLPSGRVGKYWVAFPNGFLNREAMDLLQLTPAQLRRAAGLKERIDELEHELESMLGVSATATPSRKLHWTQTPAGRAKLARSVRRSWRTRHRSLKPTATSPATTGTKLHWTQTPEGRARLARSVRKSWRTRRRS
jgi:hypothetical protein